MSKIITIELTLEDEEYDELMEHELVQGDLSDFLFAELCQNWSMGFLTGLSVTEGEE